MKRTEAYRVRKLVLARIPSDVEVAKGQDGEWTVWINSTGGQVRINNANEVDWAVQRVDDLESSTW